MDESIVIDMSNGMRYHSAEVTDVERYINDDGWAMEQKLDGVRCLVSCDAEGHVFFTGHTGSSLGKGLKHQAAIAADLAIPGLVVDGELLADGTLHIFDVLEAAGTDLRGFEFFQRRMVLEGLAAAAEFKTVQVVQSFTDTEDKARLWEAVVEAGGEGVVVKRLTGKYSTGSRSREVLKIKVTRTVDAVVMAFSTQTNSAILGLPTDNGLVKIGKCSLHCKPSVEIGDVLEVQYLYVVDADKPSLVQPRMMRVRDDKTADECDWEQLEGAATSKQAVLV